MPGLLSLGLALAAALLVTAVYPVPVRAQAHASTGILEGTVHDPDGALLPGVTVEVTNEDTGRTRTAVTNQEGYFRVPLLPPGTYTMRATLEGFRTVERTGVRLTIGSVISLDIDMPLPTVEEVLVVSGQAPVVETSKTHVSTTVEESAIDRLPILGRDFTDFTLLTPGALIENSRGTVSLSGQRGINTSVNVDGVSANSTFFGYQRGGTDAPFTISQESVREFQVITSGIMPEFGRSGGGLVNVVTKSGTNQWRGGGHLFLRDESLVAEDPLGREQSEFSVQQFGGHVGGPLVRNESFVFFSADLQQFETPFFVEFDLDDDTFGRMQSVIRSEMGVDFEQGRFIKTNDAQVYFVKWDHAFTERHNLTVRYNFSFHESINGGSFDPSGTTNFALSSQGIQDELTNSVVAQLTSLFGANAYNEFRVQFANDDLDRDPNDPVGPQTTLFRPFLGFGRAFFLPIFTREDKWQVENNFSYLFGNHDIKAGFDIETDRAADFFAGFEAGWYFFLDPDSFLDNEPLFLLQFFGNTDQPNFVARQTSAAAYVQDSWKASPELTVNYGVRWEGTFNPTPPGNPEIPETLEIPDDTDNWQPRVGVAWSPDERTVVRGSAGMFYSRTPMLLFTKIFNSNGLPDTGIFFIPGFLVQGMWPEVFDAPTGFGPSEQQVFFFDPNYGEARTVRLNAGFEREIFEDLAVGASVVYADVDGLERRFDRNLEFGFVDDSGRLIYANDGSRPVRPIPGRQMFVTEDGAFGRYKALILDFNKRFAEGFGLFGSYTLAHDEDNDSNERSAGGVQPTNIFDPDVDFGDSDRDVRHRVVLSGFVELPYGFMVSGIFTARDGVPFNALLDEDVNFDNVDDNDRPVNPDTGRVFERNAFEQPNFTNLDVRVAKRFEIGSAGSIEALFEVFNLLDNENLFVGEDRQVFTNPRFGDPNSFIGNVRQVQFGIRYVY